jgi:2',3'-cyclic-nucleotide 2'-phosphodiesterase (5'-nucleotidase family)
MQSKFKGVVAAGLSAVVAIALAPAAAISAWDSDGDVTLSLLHNNDGESALSSDEYELPSGSNLTIGGIAAFASVMDREIADARAQGNSVLTVYAGDSYLASPALNCSAPSTKDSTQTVYDAVAQGLMEYDVHILGNHEFDFGTNFLKRFINTVTAQSGKSDHTFISGNMDFSENADLSPLAAAGTLGKSYTHTDPVSGEVFGVVSSMYPDLPTVSSPGTATVTTRNIADTAVVVQAEIDALTAAGVNKIILVSHLQSLANDRELVSLLEDVDVAVAGGGDELLQAPLGLGAQLKMLPGDREDIQGDYPMIARNKSGMIVPMVTAKGNYNYLGRLDVRFDADGHVKGWDADSYPRRVIVEDAASAAVGATDAVTEDAVIKALATTPVETCTDALATTIIASTTLNLDRSRPAMRNAESAMGNLATDSQLYSYNLIASELSLPTENVIAVQNGGGLRQNGGDDFPAAGTDNISMQDVYNFMPFANKEVVFVEMSPADVRSLLERSAAVANSSNGAFLQIAGAKVTFDASYTAQVLSDDEDSIAVEGNRVRTFTLDDGTEIIKDGVIVSGAPDITVTTNAFIGAGGDGYATFAKYTPVQIGPDYADALKRYLQSFPVGDSGYPEIPATSIYSGTDGRVTLIGY